MIDLREDIRSLSEFKRHTNMLVGQMTESGRPVVLTVNGKAKLVVQDAASYQRLLESLDQREAVEGIRRGLHDVAKGRRQLAPQAFAEIRKSLNIPAKA